MLKSTLLSRERWLTVGLPGFFLVFGIAVRVIQYGFNRSLWSDEAKLALNIVDRSYADLLEPLSHNQYDLRRGRGKGEEEKGKERREERVLGILEEGGLVGQRYEF